MGIRAIHPLAVAAVAAVLGGCATSPGIEVVADSYCLASKKITWVPEDTQETIDQIVRHNSGIDRACGGVKGKKATPTS